MDELKGAVEQQRKIAPLDDQEQQPSPASTRSGRVALVIGNSAYQHANRLPNPINDLKGMSAALKRLGFDVITAADLPKSDLESQLKHFYRVAKTAEAVLLFYAGHAIQIGGRNFLIPVNAQINEETDVNTDTIDLGQIIDTVGAICPNTLVFLDACRDNPFERSLQRSMGTRAVYLGRGLAEMKQGGTDTYISYATAPGQTASDGDQANSPYTAALLAHIEEVNVELAQLTRLVLTDVRRATRGAQNPWYHSSFGHEFYFRRIAPVEGGNDNDHLKRLVERQDARRLRLFIEDNPGGQLGVEAKIALAKLEKEYFGRITRSRNPETLEKFLADFPDSDYAQDVRNSLRRLKTRIFIVFAGAALATGLLSGLPPDTSDNSIFHYFYPLGRGFSTLTFWWNLGVASCGVALAVLLRIYFRIRLEVLTAFVLAVLVGWIMAHLTAQLIPVYLDMPSLEASMSTQNTGPDDQPSAAGEPDDSGDQSELAKFAKAYKYYIYLASHGLASFIGALLSALPLGIMLRKRGLGWPIAAATISTVIWGLMVISVDAPHQLSGYYSLASLFVGWQMAFAIGLAFVFLRRAPAPG